MEDTSKKIKEKYHKMIMKKRRVERLIMGSKMEVAAREMAVSSMPDDISDTEKKLRFFYDTTRMSFQIVK